VDLPDGRLIDYSADSPRRGTGSAGMDGLCWTAGCGATIRMGGETVALRGGRLRDVALMEAEILRRRGNPFQLLRRLAANWNGDDSHRRGCLARLFERVSARHCTVSRRDLSAWLHTWPGRLFALWLAVRDHDPARYTLECVVRLAGGADWNEIARGLELASGEDERGTIDRFGRNGPGAGEVDDDDDPIDWSAIYRRLAAAPFGLSPEEIGRLTWRQLEILLDDAETTAGRVWFDSAEQLAAWTNWRNAAALRAVGNLCRGLRWDAGTGRT